MQKDVFFPAPQFEAPCSRRQRALFVIVFVLTPNSRHSAADVRGALFVLRQHVKSPM